MGQDEYGNIILSENQTTHADDLEEAEEENEFQPKHSKRKKSKQSCASAASPSIPNKIQDPHKKRRSKKRPRAFGGTHSFSLSQQPTLTEETFYGIEETEILNAGQSDESLAEFLRMYRTQTYISWTLVFLDINFTTPFLPSCEKYCTEKGPRCTHWNCTCENQVRGIQARAPIMGAMFVFPAQDSTQDDNASALMCFVLPLGRCKNLDDEPEALPPNNLEAYERMKSWSLIPFICGVSIQRRWDTFRSILTNKFIKCVTFNAIVSLMPFHFHKSQSEDRSTQGDCGGDNGSCNTAQTMLDLILPSIWDLKLAAWMLKPHAKEEELEFEKFTTGFPHLRPAPTTRPNGASYQLLGMLQAKDMLNFLYNLYPIVSSSIERKGLGTSMEEIEGPLQGILAAMECTGIGFLPSRLSSIQQKLESRIDALEVEARHIANDNTFLLSSPQQVSHILFDVLKITMPSNLPPSKAATGSQHRSTSEAVLEAIQAKSPIRIVEILLEFRSLNKLLTTYIRPLPRLARDVVQEGSDDGKNSRVRIHPMWMQTAVRTGRLSCRKPNMQQVPKGGTFGVAPRDSFCASSDELCLFACDYSQNEVRILAHMSNDKQLIQMFGNDDGIDIYKQMSSSITGKPVENVSDKERSIAKQVVLAILYGMGIPQVAKKLSVDRTTAQRFFNSFYSRFRGVKAWIDSTKESARKNGYVSTIVGRRRYLDEIQSEDNGKRAQAERQAVNSIIQGSAADLMKLAMLKMASRLMDWHKEGVNTGGTGIAPKLILQIHDELLFEVMANSGDVNRLKATVLRCCAGECERDLKLKIPLKMTCSVGKSWGVSMQEMK